MPLRIEIVSPEKRLVERDVDMAVLPGMEGDIAAMPERAPLMLQLRGGVVALYEGEQIVDRYFVGGGFADMGADHCIVLADSAQKLSELSADEARDRLRDLETQWAQIEPNDVDTHDRISREIQRVRAEIEAASGEGVI
ncbi:F0F1 ATP synthase subunit epsilon [Gluconobacter morbifer]|uniref:ATP synthase epsilon chain n=1 Tax=Gluconobacter morbifer G707 TaxID=1088869 RepID=G6XMM7_9PROT|nr:F0F1 ATP synthase subunit epsilon [Gluconobacter morbifer]EHH66980.1 ATP synthase F1 subunit epsilon [Gluconobacter morbifer G707]